MANVNIKFNGKEFLLSCDDGQEEHLLRLGKYVDKRLNELIAAVGQVGEARLLVMVSLLLTDELSDLYSKKESPSDAKEYEGVENKFEKYFSEKGAE